MSKAMDQELCEFVTAKGKAQLNLGDVAQRNPVAVSQDRHD